MDNLTVTDWSTAYLMHFEALFGVLKDFHNFSKNETNHVYGDLVKYRQKKRPEVLQIDQSCSQSVGRSVGRSVSQSVTPNSRYGVFTQSHSEVQP